MSWIYDEGWINSRVGPTFYNLYAKYGRHVGDDPQYAVWPSRVNEDIRSNGYDPEASLAKHAAECETILSGGVGPTPIPPGPVPPFPDRPTRDQRGNVCVPFQGEYTDSVQFGTFPSFGPETSVLNDEDLHAYGRKFGDRQPGGKGYTHAELAISWRYDEADFHYPVPGRDLTNDLNEVARRVRILIHYFSGGVVLVLAGDGLSQPRSSDNKTWLGGNQYNDPQGWTYGYEWLMQNLPRIVNGLKTSSFGDVTPYLIWRPGYDAVFYGWGYSGEVPDLQPDRVVTYGRLLRQLDPDCVSAIEHTPGNIPVGEGGSDYQPGGRMQDFDVIMSEFRPDHPPHGDDEWQIVGRLNRPYNRPPDQPAGDDPNPPYYLGTPNVRGPWFYVSYERKTYPWVRQRISRADVAADAQYHRNMGVKNVCFRD